MATGEVGPLSPAQAAAAMAAFFAREGLHATTPQQMLQLLGIPSIVQHPELGPLLSFRNEAASLWVSGRGNVVYYSGNVLRGARDPVDANGCIAIARSFATRHVQEFEVRNYVADPLQADASRATVQWTEKVRRGAEAAIFPNWVEVVVHIPEGRVLRFSASDLRLARLAMPAIAEAQARAIIKSRLERVAIEEIDLMQLPKDGGRSSMSAWVARVLVLTPEGPTTVNVTMDADTGEILPE